MSVYGNSMSVLRGQDLGKLYSINKKKTQIALVTKCAHKRPKGLA